MMIFEIIFRILGVIIPVYLLFGVALTCLLLQTPYADNPLWTMVLLWPLYLWHGI